MSNIEEFKYSFSELPILNTNLFSVTMAVAEHDSNIYIYYLFYFILFQLRIEHIFLDENRVK